METNEAKEYIKDFTIKFAKENFDVDVTIKFTNTYRVYGTCYKNEKIIRYSIPYIEENKDSTKALDALAIHECCHFKHPNHKNDFRLLCQSFGINETHSRELNYVKKPNSKKYYLFKCDNCGASRKKLKMMKIKYACKHCCDMYNNGHWHSDYRFKLIGYIDETKKTEK